MSGPQHHRRQRVRLVDGDAREARADGVLLQRQVEHDRRIGEELADAAAHDRVAVAARRPTRSRRAGAMSSLLSGVCALMVVAQAEIQRQLVR